MNGTSAPSGRPIEILLVDDDDNDVELTTLGFRRSGLPVNLHRVRDGEQCLEYLRREGQYADVQAPDLILLDLNMPRMGGHDVLAEIGRDEDLQHLPVIVLTTSAADSDILRSYKLRCSGYIVKPLDFAHFAKFITTLNDYWFALVARPRVAKVRSVPPKTRD